MISGDLSEKIDGKVRMNFKDRTIELSQIESLYPCRVDTVTPYSLMIAPVYVLMRRNEKLVCVKAPLDFFTEEELESLKRYEVIYLPVSIKEVGRFQTAARLHRSFIDPVNPIGARAPFEISHQVMRATAPLWGAGLRVEAFFASIFADELCGPLPADRLMQGRETAIVRHEEGILLGGALTFILVQLGWHSLFTLKWIREQVYLRTVEGESWEHAETDWESIVRDLKRAFEGESVLSLPVLASIDGDWARKLTSRIKKLGESSVTHKYESLSLNRTGGFFNEAA
jgi:hypothetical protein